MSAIVVLVVALPATIMGLLAIAFLKTLQEPWDSAGVAARDRQDVPDLPGHPFHRLCRQAGFRYIGEKAGAYVHGIFVKMDREGERLYALVPASSFEEIRSRHGQVCDRCGQRLYDLYVTGPQISDPEYYGPCTAYRIGTACGTCSKTYARHDERGSASPGAQELSQLLARKGDAAAFLQMLAQHKTAR